MTLFAILIVAFYDQVLDFLLGAVHRPVRAASRDFCGRPERRRRAAAVHLRPDRGPVTRLRVASYGGLILAMPVILWQIWRFIVPALHAKEKRYAIPFILSSVLLFLLGGVLAYLTLEKALEFLIAWSGDDVGQAVPGQQVHPPRDADGGRLRRRVPVPGAARVPPARRRRHAAAAAQGWRYAIVGIVVVAAVITPSGDPISLAALAVPMTVLYFVAVGIGWLFQRRRRRGRRGRRGLRDFRRGAPTGPTSSRALRRFPLDRFQLEAIDALDAGHHVVVAAPTGSGKTVVAEYGIETTRRAGRRRSTPRRSRRCPTRSSATSRALRAARSACSPATTPSTATPRSS